MTFQTLISTMNNRFSNRDFKPPCDFIVINQHSHNKADKIKDKTYFYFKEKGLAKSRNHALELATSDICHISDDDLTYVENIEQIILNAFKEHKEADIITFQIQTPEGIPFKDYKKESFRHTKRSIMSVCSVEIAFKRDCIKKQYLKFDEKFGLGSDFPTGEEIIFLSDALKKGLNIRYVPVTIAMHPLESSGANYHDSKLIKAKGAMFYRLFGFTGHFISILYAYKKYKFSPFSLKEFTSMMFRGIKKYRSYT